MTKDQKEGGVERRTRTNSLVKNMLKERSQLLTLLLQVSPGNAAHALRPDADVLREFCQVLVDYIAAGHFGLFERSVSGEERRASVSQLTSSLLPRLEQTTEVAMAFDDKYAPDNGDADFSRLAEDLSELGEQLTTRFELEDRLFGLYLDPVRKTD